ncbi:MAG: glycosyltransferase [Aristaeellaceae bacterium]
MRALILSAHTGGGHDAAAYALRDALSAQGVESRVEDCLAFGGKQLSKLVCGTYVNMVRYVPELFGKVYKLGRKISSARYKSPVYYVNASYAFRMEQLLAEYQPDIILCTHLFGGQTVTRLKHKGDFRGVLGMVMTDYTVHPFSEDVEADALFIAHEDNRRECIERKIPQGLIHVTGIPVNPACQPCEDKQAAKRALGLNEHGREVLLVGGSMGAGHLPRVIGTLLPALHADDHLTVICGSNAKAKAEAEAQYAGESRVSVKGRVSPLYPLMAAADVLVTKSGGLTTSEAMTVGTPMVIINPIEGCETANASLFECHGLAAYCHTPEELPVKLGTLLHSDAQLQAMIAAQRHEINPRAAADIAATMIHLAEQQKKKQA